MDGNNEAVERREAMQEFLSTPDESTEEVEEVETPAEEEEIEEGSEEGESGEQETPKEGEGDEEEEESEQSEDTEESDQPPADDSIDEEELTHLQDRNEAFEGLVEALDGTDYPIDFSDLEKGMGEVGLRLADAHAMYLIVDGKAGAESVFDRLLKFQGQDVHDAVLNKVLQYAQKRGLIEGGGEPGKEGDFNDPLVEENKKLREQLASKSEATATNLAQDRQKKIFDSAVSELNKLATKSKVDDWTVSNVLIPAMARGVGGQKAIINRIARGNFVDIQRLFDETMNHVGGHRVKVSNEKVAGRKTRDQQVPRRVTGSGKPTGAAASHVDLSTSEGRRAAAKAALRG